jgi:hypothetical protein
MRQSVIAEILVTPHLAVADENTEEGNPLAGGYFAGAALNPRPGINGQQLDCVALIPVGNVKARALHSLSLFWRSAYASAS